MCRSRYQSAHIALNRSLIMVRPYEMGVTPSNATTAVSMEGGACSPVPRAGS